MRGTKSAEQRRADILDTAMRLFYRQGFTHTSIGDIARAMGVAQGFCYRYFPSKEALLREALEHTAKRLAQPVIGVLGDENRTLREKIHLVCLYEEEASGNPHLLMRIEPDAYLYGLLYRRVCLLLEPPARRALELAKWQGETPVQDTETAVSFCLYGQEGLLRRRDLTVAGRLSRLEAFLCHILHI